MTYPVKSYAARSPTSPLGLFDLDRRSPRADDVVIEVLYCGVCHSDLHNVRNEWGNAQFPMVPGHEIVGRVLETGAEVTRFAAGDRVGVGCLVDSCRRCAACGKGWEQYCENGFTLTYNDTDRVDGSRTYGGYSEKIVVGADVTLFSRSPGKEDDARRLGAGQVVISTDPAQMAAVAGRFDLIIDTVPERHDVNPYVPTLGTNGTIVMVGYLGPLDPPFNSGPLVFSRKALAGSLMGGLPETQEMLDFCAEHGIQSDIEVIRIQDIDTAYERMLRADVKYRFVIDMASLHDEVTA